MEVPNNLNHLDFCGWKRPIQEKVLTPWNKIVENRQRPFIHKFMDFFPYMWGLSYYLLSNNIDKKKNISYIFSLPLFIYPYISLFRLGCWYTCSTGFSRTNLTTTKTFFQSFFKPSRWITEAKWIITTSTMHSKSRRFPSNFFLLSFHILSRSQKAKKRKRDEPSDLPTYGRTEPVTESLRRD